MERLSPQEYWLTVGVLEPRKNHRGLLKAYALLKQELGKTFPLVLAGGKGWMLDDLQEQLASLHLQDDVIPLGYVEDLTLQWLYQNCFAFVYPSFFEGFGLPVLEAMALGAPVIAADASSIPEIVGKAGILVDPLSETELARAMIDLSAAADQRLSLKDRAPRQAAHFSWKSAASSVLECYRNLPPNGREYFQQHKGK